MPIRHPHSDALVNLVAKRFRLIGEPMRIRLLDRLRAGDASVGDLADALEASQQNISKHLAALHRAGVVGRRKAGNHVVYSIADDSVFTLCEIVCGGLQNQSSERTRILAGPSDLAGSGARETGLAPGRDYVVPCSEEAVPPPMSIPASRAMLGRYGLTRALGRTPASPTSPYSIGDPS